MMYDVDFKTGKIRWQKEVRSAAPTARARESCPSRAR